MLNQGNISPRITQEKEKRHPSHPHIYKQCNKSNEISAVSRILKKLE